MSFSAARWLNEKSGDFYKRKDGYYYYYGNQWSQYFTHNVDQDALEDALYEQAGDAKNILARQNAVKQHDLKTKENALHVVLSNKIFRYSDSQKDAATLMQSDFELVEYGKDDVNVDRLFGLRDFPQIKKRVEGKSDRDKTFYAHDVYGNRIASSAYHFEWEDDKTSFNQWVTQQNHGTEAELKEYIYKNHAVTLKDKIKSVKNRAQEQTAQLLTVLLQPFEKDDKALWNLLMERRETQGETPLHCALRYINHSDAFKPLSDRVKSLPENCKEELLLARDAQGKNPLHVGARWDSLNRVFVEIWGFSLGAIKKALAQADNTGNTPLHDFCQSNNAYAHIKFVHEKCKSATNSLENKAEPVLHLEAAFAHNSYHAGGHNPLHLACKRKQEAKEDKEIVSMLRDIMGEEFFVRKMKQQDKDGCIPLHYAIETGNNEMVAALLEKLSEKDKQEIISIKNKKNESALHYAIKNKNAVMVVNLLEGLSPQNKSKAALAKNDKETTLHYACRYGDITILTAVVEALGPMDLYEIYKSEKSLLGKNGFEKLVLANSNLTLVLFQDLIKKHTVLFETFDHLNHPGVFKDIQDNIARCNDFVKCWPQLREGKPLPEEPMEFTKGKTRDYSTRRSYFSSASKQQIEEFPEFLRGRSTYFSKQLLGVDKLSQLPVTSSQQSTTGLAQNNMFVEQKRILVEKQEQQPAANDAMQTQATVTSFSIAAPTPKSSV